MCRERLLEILYKVIVISGDKPFTCFVILRDTFKERFLEVNLLRGEANGMSDYYLLLVKFK